MRLQRARNDGNPRIRRQRDDAPTIPHTLLLSPMTSSFQSKDKKTLERCEASLAQEGEKKNSNASATLAQPIPVDPLRFRQLTRVQLADLASGARAGKDPFDYIIGESADFGPEYRRTKRIKGHARDIVVPSTGHIRFSRCTDPFYKCVSTSRTFHQTYRHTQHTTVDIHKTSTYTYTRVYKNGEHNEILGRCARTRVAAETLSPGISGFANSN